MIDQATELRKLVLQAMRENAAAAGPPPRLVVATSGQKGAGVTTLAVNLSVALAEQGLRVVVVDADPDRGEVAACCGLSGLPAAADPLAAHRDIHEVMQRGPAGIQIVPALWASGEALPWNDNAQERLLRQFRTLGRHADLVLVDAGGGHLDFFRRCCRLADDVLLVTLSDPAAVMESYARIKSTAAGLETARLRLIVNRCDSAGLAAEVQQRIGQSCQRFLKLAVTLLGHVPHEDQVTHAAARHRPFVIDHPTCQATRAVHRLAVGLTRQDEQDHGLRRAAA